MSRNIVPRANKDSDLGTAEKNWNRLFADAVILRGSDLKSLLDGKVDLDTLAAKGDLYVATDAGVITRLPAGTDGYVLKTNSGDPKGLTWGPAGARQELTEDITVTVGSGGDFSTINAALENIVSLYYPKYISGGNCPKVTINLLSGFVMSEQVLIESLNLSWIKITGVDAETTINRGALTKFFGDGYPAFAASNGAFLPIIGQLFNMDTSGDGTQRNGILAHLNSRAGILRNCGVKNAGRLGIFAFHGSIINANGAKASGAGETCFLASRCSMITAGNTDASGSGNIGILASNNSLINADNANASNAGQYGIRASFSSKINALNANASGAGLYGIRVSQGGIVNAAGSTGTILPSTPNTITADGIIFK